MRKSLMAGNWKMNMNSSEAYALIDELVKQAEKKDDREVLICPPYIYLENAVKRAENSQILVGAQNICWEEKGAYTGEISAAMLKDIQVDYVIIGHSERREYQKEDNQLLNKKIRLALNNGLKVIYCVGEKLEEREAGKEKEVVGTQVKEGLDGYTSEEMKNMVIAYEPVWAIGTGKTATPEQAQDMHDFIRKTISENFNEETADGIRILYGGSVKPDNVDNLMSKEDIDGALVGGASLKADSFMRIVNYQ